jgi:hypothetical protein
MENTSPSPQDPTNLWGNKVVISIGVLLSLWGSMVLLNTLQNTPTQWVLLGTDTAKTQYSLDLMSLKSGESPGEVAYTLQMDITPQHYQINGRSVDLIIEKRKSFCPQKNITPRFKSTPTQRLYLSKTFGSLRMESPPRVELGLNPVFILQRLQQYVCQPKKPLQQY